MSFLMSSDSSDLTPAGGVICLVTAVPNKRTKIYVQFPNINKDFDIPGLI